MNWLDLAALVVIGLAAANGFRRGLIVGVCSLGGLVAGAYAGARLAPEILSGHASTYPPLVTFGGAVIGSTVGRIAAVTLGRSVRRALQVGLLKGLDDVGGALLGGLTGVAFVWVLAAIVLYVPGDAHVRREVQRSQIVGRLTTALPPSHLIGALVRIDPFQSLAGPPADVGVGDPGLLFAARVEAARRSVVRVIGLACGVGVEGSGWVAAPGLVVTNAHVVAGVDRPLIDRQDGDVRGATVVSFDVRNDLAVLQVPGLRGRPLPLAKPQADVPVAVLGFPENGPYRALPGRLGQTVPTFVRDAYGRFPVARNVTTIRARIRPGNSGGPIVDALGRVRAVVFARRASVDGGFGIPSQIVRAALLRARSGSPVSTQCAP